MPWYRLPDGLRRFAQPNTRRERELLALDARLETFDDQPVRPAVEGNLADPPETFLAAPVREVVERLAAAPPDYELIDQLIRYETHGRNRTTLLRALERMRVNDPDTPAEG